MADAYIQVAPDSNGKQLQTFSNLVSGETVHAEAVVLVDTSGATIATLPVSGPLTDAQLRALAVPVSGTFFQATQPVNGTVNVGNFPATQTVAGTVTANQGGTWYLQAINSTLTVNSPNASNFLATVTGTVAATQSGTWGVQSTNASNFLSTVSGTVTAIQSNASNLLTTVSGAVTVSGTVTANAGTNFNLGGASMANGQVAATTTPATLVAARATRRSVCIRNANLSIDAYIGLPVISSSNGMLIKAGESISVDYTGLIQVVAASNSPIICYLETYD